MERLRAEVEMLRAEHPSLQCGADLDWVLIADFPLPPGWNRERTRLLLLVPSGYPQIPPDNFYVDVGLRTSGGAMPGSYSEPVGQIGDNWGQFSWHAEMESWRPAPEPAAGHNLRTVVDMIRKRLSEVP